MIIRTKRAADIIASYKAALKSVKRNKSGSLNRNSLNNIEQPSYYLLRDEGSTNLEAWHMIKCAKAEAMSEQQD